MMLPSTGMWKDYGETGLQKGEIIFGLGGMCIGHLRRNTEQISKSGVQEKELGQAQKSRIMITLGGSSCLKSKTEFNEFICSEVIKFIFLYVSFL